MDVKYRVDLWSQRADGVWMRVGWEVFRARNNQEAQNKAEKLQEFFGAGRVDFYEIKKSKFHRFCRWVGRAQNRLKKIL